MTIRAEEHFIAGKLGVSIDALMSSPGALAE